MDTARATCAQTQTIRHHYTDNWIGAPLRFQDDWISCIIPYLQVTTICRYSFTVTRLSL